MGDSSGSVSIDVERIFFGGKVCARVPPASPGFLHSVGLGAFVWGGFDSLPRGLCLLSFSTSSSCGWFGRGLFACS